MRRRRFRNAPSSKSDVVESLLALGDVARNNQLGEAKAALAKARVFIDKFNLTHFEARYQQLMAKAAAFERGEKVERDDASQSRSGRTGYGHSREDPFSGWQGRWQDFKRRAYSSSGYSRSSDYTRDEREQTRRAAEQAREEARRRREQARREYERAKRDARYDATRRQREEKKARQAEEKKAYIRPPKPAKIEWLWQHGYSPKRGKAGERWKAYVGAKTVGEMLEKGGKWSDVKWNVTHGLMRVER